MTPTGLNEYQKLQAKEIAREAVRQMKEVFISKREFYAWLSMAGFAAVGTMLGYAFNNPEILRAIIK